MGFMNPEGKSLQLFNHHLKTLKERRSVVQVVACLSSKAQSFELKPGYQKKKGRKEGRRKVIERKEGRK
jgi:hypothetical protein